MAQNYLHKSKLFFKMYAQFFTSVFRVHLEVADGLFEFEIKGEVLRLTCSEVSASSHHYASNPLAYQHL